ncbi:MAG: ferredoxin family protein [Chloroflexota bacterium]
MLVPYVICSPCIDVMDTACQEVCPVDCIYYQDEDRMLYINPDECIDCGACVPECPVNAIYEESEVPAQWKDFIRLNALWFEDRAAARCQVDDLAPSPA